MGESKRRKQSNPNYGDNNGLPKLAAEQIKWAWSKCVAEKPQAALMEGIPLMCAEVMRTDEIGMVTAAGRQITIVRHLQKRKPKGQFEMMASQDFSNVSWTHLFEFLNLPDTHSNSAKAIVSGFELLLYRPGRGQLYTPLKYASYDQAVAGCDRHLFFLLNVLSSPSLGSIVCMAHVDEPLLQAVFQKQIIISETSFVQAVDTWTSNIYNDDIAEQRYQALAEFPLAEPPADSDDQSPIAEIQLDNAVW